MAKMNKRGQTLASLGPLAMLLVVGMLTVAIGSQVIGQMADTQCTNLTTAGQCEPNGLSAAHNVTFGTLDTFQNMSNLVPVIGVVLIAGVILGALAFFGGR